MDFFDFREIADLEELKGGYSRPSGLMTLIKSKNLRFFSCFGSDDPQHSRGA